MLLDFWTIILLFVGMAGLMNWYMIPFTTAIFWFCDLRDGNTLDFGMEVLFMLFFGGPLAWMYPIITIYLLYCK